MNKFVSSLLGAFTGTWIAFFVIGIFIFFSGIAMISSLASSTISPIATIGDNAILRIDLSGSITDKPYNKSLHDFGRISCLRENADVIQSREELS